MSAVMEAREPSAKYLSTLQTPLVQQFELMATAPGGVARLRELILTLAVQGKLVPQDPKDEPASELLEKICAERERLVTDGKARRSKPLEAVAEDEKSFSLPVGWEWVRLGDIQIFTNGYAFKSMHFADSGVGVVRIGNVQAGEITTAGMVYLPDSMADEIDNQFFIEPGDLVITMTGDVKLGFNRTSNRFLLNQRVGKITPLLVKPTYLVFCLSLVAEQKIADASGSVIPNVSTGEINSTPFALPPLAEQARIVTRVEDLMRLCDALEAKGQLDAAHHAQLVKTLLGALTASTTPDELADNWQRVATHFDLLLDRPEAVDALEQTILQLAVRGLLVPQDPKDEPASVLLQKIRAEKDRLIAAGKIKRDKSLLPIAEEEKPFVEPHGWEWVRLQQAYDVRDGTHDTPKYQSTGYPLVTSKNIYGGVLDLSDVKLISPIDHQQISARSKVDRNDILFAMIGSIGNPVLIDTDVEFSVKNVALFKYYGAWLSCPQYLLLVLQTEAVGMKARAAGGVQSFISLGQLRSSVVALPPLAEQSRIVARVESLRRLCADLRQRLAARHTTQAHLAEALIDEVA